MHEAQSRPRPPAHLLQVLVAEPRGVIGPQRVARIKSESLLDFDSGQSHSKMWLKSPAKALHVVITSEMGSGMLGEVWGFALVTFL